MCARQRWGARRVWGRDIARAHRLFSSSRCFLPWGVLWLGASVGPLPPPAAATRAAQPARSARCQGEASERAITTARAGVRAACGALPARSVASGLALTLVGGRPPPTAGGVRCCWQQQAASARSGSDQPQRRCSPLLASAAANSRALQRKGALGLAWPSAGGRRRWGCCYCQQQQAVATGEVTCTGRLLLPAAAGPRPPSCMAHNSGRTGCCRQQQRVTAGRASQGGHKPLLLAAASSQAGTTCPPTSPVAPPPAPASWPRSCMARSVPTLFRRLRRPAADARVRVTTPLLPAAASSRRPELPTPAAQRRSKSCAHLQQGRVALAPLVLGSPALVSLEDLPRAHQKLPIPRQETG